MRDRQRGRVGAEAEIRGVTERRHAAGAHQNCRLAAKSANDEHVGREHERVLVARVAAAARRQHDATAAAMRLSRPGGTTSARCSGSASSAAAASGVPSSPCGFNASTIAITIEFGDQRELRKRDVDAGDVDRAERDAQRLGEADQQRGDERAGDRAQSADHGDDERFGDDREIHAEIRRLARQLQRAGQAGAQRAERKHRA